MRSTDVIEQVKILLTTMGFLTRIPVSSRMGFDPSWLARGTVYFPVVGCGVGLLAGAAFLLFSQGLPQGLSLALTLAFAAAVTGALHEDGLADALDGLGGGGEPEEILTIMQDSRVGTYGILGLIFVTLISYSALASLAPAEVVRALIAAHVLARWSSLPLLWRSPYVRAQSPAGKPFVGAVTPGRLVLASTLTVFFVTFALGWRGVLPSLSAVVVSLSSGLWYRRKLGGITGDCLGATNKLVEVVTYVAVVVQFHRFA